MLNNVGLNFAPPFNDGADGGWRSKVEIERNLPTLKFTHFRVMSPTVP